MGQAGDGVKLTIPALGALCGETSIWVLVGFW